MTTERRPRPTRTDWQTFVPHVDESPGTDSAQAPQEEASFLGKVWGSAKAVGEGLTYLPSGVVDTVQDAFWGFDPTDREEMAQREQREKDLQAYQQKYKGQAFEGVTGAMTSMPYSAATMGAGVLGGVGGAFAGPVGAGAASMAASGGMAYGASVAEFNRTMYGVTTEALGREPSLEEWERVRANFSGEAAKYGLWEAGPEAVSNLLMVKILGPLGSKFKGGIKDAIKRVAGLYGEELGTETITQMGQGALQADLGLRENAPGVVDAFNEIFSDTFWQTTLMAGGKKGIDLAYRKVRGNSGQNPPPDTGTPPAPAAPYVLTQSPENMPVPTGPVGEAIEPDEILYDGAFINGAVVSSSDHSPVNLLGLAPASGAGRAALPQGAFSPVQGVAGAFALPPGTGAMPMGMDQTGQQVIAPSTDFSSPLATPYTPRPALPAASSGYSGDLGGASSSGPGQWSGGRSQLAYPYAGMAFLGGLSGGHPGGSSGSMGPSAKSAPALPTSSGTTMQQAIPSSSQITNTQQAPRADTMHLAAALGMPAPAPVPQEAQQDTTPQVVPQAAPQIPQMAEKGIPQVPPNLGYALPSVVTAPYAGAAQVAEQGANLSLPVQTPSPVPNTRNAWLAQVSAENTPFARKLDRASLARLVATEQTPEPFSNIDWTREDYPMPTAQGGTVFTSGSGRRMAPFPVVDYSTSGKRKTSNAKAAAWLLDEAKKEANGHLSFMRHLNSLTPGNLPPATVSELTDVLTNGAPKETPRILRPLVEPTAVQAHEGTKETQDAGPYKNAKKQPSETSAEPQTYSRTRGDEQHISPSRSEGVQQSIALHPNEDKAPAPFAEQGEGRDISRQTREDAQATSPGNDLSTHFTRKFLEGAKYANIGQARRESFELTGKKLVHGTNDVKALDEAIELGVVKAARSIITEMRDKGAADVEIFRRLVELYKQQPNLSSRTSTSIAQQAYSTPAPLAFLASHLAGITDATTVYEPTAGNGMLIMEANPETAVVNELNPDRAARLRSLGFTVTEADAATHEPGKSVDVVIANPPFGRVRDDHRNPVSWTVAGYETKELDHAIVLKALEAMQPNGRAVLIVGGKQGNDETRASKYHAAMQRQFYRALFDAYKVVDHFTVDGTLYERQGAGYPVDFIVIDGKGRTTDRPFPAAELPRIYDSFEALEGVIHGRRPEVHTGMDAGGRAEDSGIRGRAGDQGRRGSDGATVSVDSAHDPDSGSGGRGSGRRGHGESDAPGRDVQSGSGLEASGQGGFSADRHPSDLRRQFSGTPHEQDGGTRRGVSEQDGGRQRHAGGTAGHDAGRVGGEDAHPVSGRELVSKNQEGTKAASKPQKVNAQKATAHQEPYTPRSEASSMGTLVPRNMASPLKSALKSLEKRRGNIDDYVSKELGYSPADLKKYFAGEQIDAIGLAIDNISQGAGFIIGDQTGIGKGRVNAAIIRYARQKGLTPVFITMKPDLYADMIRDLNDIGESDFNPLPTNAGLSGKEAIPLPDGRKLSTKDSQKHAALLRQAAENGVADFDAVFTTYDQLNPSKKEDRRDFMRDIAPRALFILDESHNAGGSESGKTRKAKNAAPSRAEFVRELLALSPHGAFYSSATYAKRPDVMSLYFKTDMRHAVDDMGKLAEAVSAGGIPLQQVVAAQLTESGQYIRRERSFEGASVEVTHAEAKLEHAEQSATIMRTILAFDTLKQKAMEAVKQDARGAGEDVGDSSATGEKGANSTNFTSVMHNLIGQSLLAMKARAAAEEAALAVERGEKPVLTLANTMGSFIEEHVRGNDVPAGGELHLSFKDLFKRYLDKTRTLTRKDSSGKKVIESRLLTDEELGEAGAAAYKDALQLIERSVFEDLPISPIDFITAELEQRGIRVGEITGRTHAVEYRDGVPYYRARKTSSAQNIETMRKFNNGELDTMILNQSGSTGISLHSSSTFNDQRRRTMIIVQPELNIDVFMQTLGRVFRTGQVVPPSYKLLTSDIPAEKRPAAVLGKKMAGLNANTTASRTTDTTFQNIPDFLNEYGDIVAAQIMEEESELHAALGYPLTSKDKGLSREDAVRKVTGRIPMLPLKEQQALYERIEADYRELIAQLEATGGSTLEAKTLPLDARLLDSSELTPAREDTDSPFAAESRLGLFDVKVLGKPYTPEQVRELIEKGRESVPDMESVRKNTLDWLNKKLETIENEETQESLRERTNGQMQTVRRIVHELVIGKPVFINTVDAAFTGVVTRIDTKGKGNPAAPSSWRVTVAVADAAKQITVPFSKVKLDTDAELGVGGALIRGSTRLDFNTVMEAFASGQTAKREKRYIAFGNVLAAYASVGSRGQVVNFENSDGTIRAGILYKKDSTKDSILGTSAVSFPDFEAVSAFFAATKKQGIVKSADGNLVLAANGEAYKFTVPASKAKGAQFFLNGKLLEAAGKDFVKSGNLMGLTVDQSTAAKMVEVLREQGFGLVAGSHRDEARQVMGMDDKPMASLRKETASDSSVVGRISEEVAKNLPPLHKAGDIRLDAEGIAHIEERHGKDIRKVGFHSAVEFVQYVVENFDSIYQGTGPRDVALVVHDGKNLKRAILKLEFASDGDFYRVKTAGPVGSGFYKNKSLLWKRAPTSQLSKESPNAISGQSRLSEKNDTASDADVNEFQSSIAPGAYLPPRPERRTRTTLNAVKRVVTDLHARAKNAVPTKVVASFSELPRRIQALAAGKETRLEGVYDPATRIVYLVTDNLISPERAADVWMHEQVGHGGLDALLSPGEQARLMNHLWSVVGGMGNTDVAAIATRYGLKPRTSLTDRVLVMKEYIAHLAEQRRGISPQEARFWQRFVRRVMEIWNRMVEAVSGRKSVMTAQGIDALLSALERHVFDGPQTGMAGTEGKALASVGKADPVAAGHAAWRQVQEDTARWGRELDEFTTRKNMRSLLTVCRTPDVLQKLGAQDLPMTITGDKLGKVMSGNNDHQIPADLLKKFPAALAEPVMVFDSASEPGSFVVLTEIRHEGRSVMVAVELDAEQQRLRVNNISSAYKRKESWYITQIEEGRLLYQDKKKSLAWARTNRLQLPKVRKLPARLSEKRLLTEADVVKPVRPANDTPLASLRDVFGPRATPGRHLSGISDAELAENPALGAAMRKIGSEKPSLAERWESLKENWQRRVEQGIFDQFASLKDVSTEGYRQARMTTSLGTQLHAMLHYGAPVWKEGSMGVRGKSLTEVFAPVADEVDRYLRWMVGVRADRLKKEGREHLFGQEEIDALKGLAHGRTADGRERAALYKAVSRDFAEFKTAVLDFAQESGLINPDSRAMWENADYIPFYRIQERMDGVAMQGPKAGRGLTGQQSGVKRLKGGLENIGDPLENIMRNLAHMIDAAQKNRASVSILRDMERARLAERLSPAAMYAELQTQGRIMAEAMREEFGTDTVFGPFSDKEKKTILSVFTPPGGFVSSSVDGKPQWFTVSDPLLYRALTNMRQTELRNNPVWQFFRGARRLLTTAVTAMPDFIVRNFLRDTLSVWAQEHRSSFRPLMDSLKQVKQVYKVDDDMRQLLASGAAFTGSGYRMGNSAEVLGKELDTILDKYRMDKDAFSGSLLDTPKKLARFVGKAWENYERAGSAAENSSRLAVYKKLRAKGYTHAEAAYAAKDLMDFSMRGEWEIVRTLTEVVPFLGARLAGLHRLGRGALEDPRAFAFKGLTIAGASVALYVLNQMFHGAEWDELEDWDKDSYFHFWIGDEHFRLPKPFEVGFIFGTIPERIAEQLMSSTPGRVLAARVASGMLEQLAFNPLPQAVTPLVEQAANRNFFRDRPIVSMGLERRLPVDQYRESTSLTARAFARFTDALIAPLAGKADAGALDALRSPVRIEHLVQGYLGGLGTALLGLSDVALRRLTDAPDTPEQRLEDMLIIRAFYRGNSSAAPGRTRYESALYDALSTADKVHAMIRDGEAGEMRGKLSDREVLALANRKGLRSAATAIGKLNQTAEKIRASSTLTATQKRQRLDVIQIRKNTIAREIVRRAENRTS